MKEDTIELVGSVLLDYIEEKKTNKIPYKIVMIFFRSETENYSSTSFREFVISLKSLEILRKTGKTMVVFNPEKFKEYLKLMKR